MNFIKLLVLFLVLISCSHNATIERLPQSLTGQESCNSLVSAFDQHYLTHPNNQQFKTAEDFHLFQETLSGYSVSQERLLELSADPDHNNFIGIKSIKEAQAILISEHKQIVPGPIDRGAKEIDFYDSQGRPWDIKTPISPPRFSRWSFDRNAVINSIEHQLSVTYRNKNTGKLQPVRVLLDFRETKRRDRKIIENWIKNHLNQSERSRIRSIR